jgi:hypothetical protein
MGRNNDIREVDRAFKAAGLPDHLRPDFGRFLERCKRNGDRGTKNDQGDYTWDELMAKTDEFKETR